MDKSLVVIAIGIVLFVGTAAFLSVRKEENSRGATTSPVTTSSPTSLESPQAEQATPSPTPTNKLIDPVEDFKQRVTKKFFGTYVTPNNSPVQPEKFTGYHTGADAEYGDVAGDVPVHAIADGTVLVARRASGYGGVIAIQHEMNNEKVIAIYGHINPSSLPKVGQKVSAGQQIGILGKAFSSETDGERKHLHFGLVKGTVANIKGYVSKKSELSAWIDPLTVF